MASFANYVWIYGLAEALALAVLAAIVFGVKWWRLQQQRNKLTRTCHAIAAMLREEIAKKKSHMTTTHESRDYQIACLQTLMQPFQKKTVDEEQVWKNVLNNLDNHFDELLRTTCDLAALKNDDEINFTHGSEFLEEDYAEVDNELSSLKMDADIDAILSQYQIDMETLAANQKLNEELKQKYQNLEHANQDLQSEINEITQLELNSPLGQQLDAFRKSSLEFMRQASVAKSHCNSLSQQIDVLEAHLHHHQVNINHYRKSVHKLLINRDTLAKEKKQLIAQIKETNRLVARLNARLSRIAKQMR